MHRSRWMMGGLVGVAVAAVSFSEVVATYQNYLVEKDYLMTSAVLRLVDDYANERGDWPRAWRDLEQVKQPEWSGRPGDLTAERQRIAVEFSAQIEDLAQQTVEQFQAVRPFRPNALFDDDILRRGKVGPLLETLRRLDGRKREAAERR